MFKMDDGVGSYLKNLFNQPMGIVASNKFKKTRKGSEEEFSTEREKLVEIFEEEQHIKDVLSEFEVTMINRVLKLHDTKAKDVMVPRTVAFAIDIEDELSENLDEIIGERYSRIPVYEKDIDNIIGLVHIKDLFAQAKKGNIELINLRGILREPYFVHEFMSIDKLLIEMQKNRSHMAIVINEYGGFSGILTIEDILEEIVGEIADEDDEEEINQDIIKISNTTYKIDGFVSVDSINDMLDLNLPTNVTETMGGLLLERLGKIPEDDSDKTNARIGDVELKAIKSTDKRIESLILKIHR
ncbi:MAG: hemolysin family protein [Filifactoraceae bacterium]